MLNRSLIVNNKVRFKEKLLYEDQLWMFFLMKHLENVYICNEVTYHYCIRPGSLTTTDKKTKGENLQIVFDEILNHLTLGKEKKELRGYFYKFSYMYLLYVGCVPSLKNILALYQKRAKMYGCLFIILALILVDIIGHLSNPLIILKKLNAFRKKTNNLVG